MPKDDLAVKIASYRETAATLREIAEQLRGDPHRVNQIRSLADGVERYARTRTPNGGSQELTALRSINRLAALHLIASHLIP